jgi:hypothetical protein
MSIASGLLLAGCLCAPAVHGQGRERAEDSPAAILASIALHQRLIFGEGGSLSVCRVAEPERTAITAAVAAAFGNRVPPSISFVADCESTPREGVWPRRVLQPPTVFPDSAVVWETVHLGPEMSYFTRYTLTLIGPAVRTMQLSGIVYSLPAWKPLIRN